MLADLVRRHSRAQAGKTGRRRLMERERLRTDRGRCVALLCWDKATRRTRTVVVVLLLSLVPGWGGWLAGAGSGIN